MLVKCKTKSGFECEVETKKLSNDWRFAQIVSNVNGGNRKKQFWAAVDIIDLLLTKEQQNDLTEHLETVLPKERSEYGVSIDDVLKEVFEIVNIVQSESKDVKNS